MDLLIPLAKVLDVKIVRGEGYGNNQYGPVRSGTLKSEGFMRKIWFDFDGKGGFKLSVADTLVDGEKMITRKVGFARSGKTGINAIEESVRLILTGT